METLAATSNPARPTHGVFCQAPLGVSDLTLPTATRSLPNLLNTWGCFVEFGDDTSSRPSFLSSATSFPARYRYRLMEMVTPSERLTVYNLSAQTPSWHGWFTDSLSGSARPVHVLAENVIGLLLLPKLSPVEETARRQAGKTMLSTDFHYDSTETNPDGEINSYNQLPPVMEVAMVVLDEASAGRLRRPEQRPGTRFANQ